MDIYLATGFALLVVGLCAFSRVHFTRYLFLIAGVLAISGCLSLRLGSNDKPQTTVSQAAGPSGPAGSIAEPVPSPRS